MDNLYSFLESEDSILPKYREFLHRSNFPILASHHSSNIFSSYSNLISIDKHEKSLDHFILSWKKIFYESELKRFNKRLAKNETIEIMGYVPSETIDCIYRKKIELAKENDIIRKIINLLRVQLFSYDASTEKELNILKALILRNEEKGNIIYLDYSFNEWSEFVEFAKVIKEKITLLKEKLTYRLKSFFIKIGRDIRQCYRNIIHFLFKNLDDQSGDDYDFYVFIGWNLKSLTSLNFCHQWTIKKQKSIYLRY